VPGLLAFTHILPSCISTKLLLMAPARAAVLAADGGVERWKVEQRCFLVGDAWAGIGDGEEHAPLLQALTRTPPCSVKRPALLSRLSSTSRMRAVAVQVGQFLLLEAPGRASIHRGGARRGHRLEDPAMRPILSPSHLPGLDSEVE
jgi:hypothetical protein